jgi:hypothetical protein
MNKMGVGSVGVSLAVWKGVWGLPQDNFENKDANLVLWL